MLSRTCVAIEIKWKKAGVFNRDLRLLQFLIVIEWITSKHFDVILPHPIKDVYVETADPARYNDCRYVRSRWHVYTYTVGSLEFVISLSPVRPTFHTFPFLPLFHVRLLSVSSYTFTKSQLGFSFLSLPHVAGSLLASPKLLIFIFRGYIFVRLNDIGAKLSNIRANEARKSHECVHPPALLHLHHHSTPGPTTFVVRRTTVEYSTVHYAFIQFSHLESVAKLCGNGFCTMLLTLN